MKIFKWFLTLLYGIITAGIVSLVVWGSNVFVNIGGTNVDVPNFLKLKNDKEGTWYFSNNFEFSWISMKNAHLSHEVFIDTSSGDEKLWFVPMAWANKTLTWSKNMTTAVFAPSYELEQLEKYRNSIYLYKRGYEDGTDIYKVASPEEISEKKYNGIYFGNYEDLSINLGDYITFVDEDGNYADLSINLDDYITFVDEDVIIDDSTYTVEIDDSIYTVEIRSDEHKILKREENNKHFNNEAAKINKYKQEEYDKFVKYLNNKSVVKWAYAEIIIIIVLTMYVVYQNPIDFERTDDGTTEISNNLIPRVPRPRKRRNKNKERRNN